MAKDFSAFNHPKIMFAEHVVEQAGAAGNADRFTFEDNQLRVSRDTIVDLLVVTEESRSGEEDLTDPNGTFLHYLGVNYRVTERPDWVKSGDAPIETFHNFHEGDRSGGAIPDALTTGYTTAWGKLQWNFFEPWIYEPIDTLTVQFTAPATALGYSGYFPVFGVHGRGSRTGMPRFFYIPDVAVPQLLPNIIFAQTYNSNQHCNNLGDEPFKIYKMDLAFSNRLNANGNNDTRLLNVWRMKVTPSIGDSWSDHPVPLIFHGVHMSLPHRIAYHRPPGGPIYLRAGQSISFDIRNYHWAKDTNVQVGFIGRVAPGVGSVI